MGPHCSLTPRNTDLFSAPLSCYTPSCHRTFVHVIPSLQSTLFHDNPTPQPEIIILLPHLSANTASQGRLGQFLSYLHIFLLSLVTVIMIDTLHLFCDSLMNVCLPHQTTKFLEQAHISFYPPSYCQCLTEFLAHFCEINE